MHISLVTRRAGAKPAPPDRCVGVAATVLLSIGLVTAPAWGRGRLTPYEAINAAAAASPITVHRLRGGVVMLEGSGGNIGVLKQPGGLLMVDAGIGVSEAKIKAALQGLDSGPLKTVILTHWHWDHSDGSRWVRRTGARLIAGPKVIARPKQTIQAGEAGHTFTPVDAASLPDEALNGDRTLPFGNEKLVVRDLTPSFHPAATRDRRLFEGPPVSPPPLG